MSEADRIAIAAAVTTVEGLNCKPYFRQSVKAGDAMVRFDRLIRDQSGFGFINVWQVLLALPQSIAEAEKYLEEKLSLALAAVEPELVITGAQPKELLLEGGVTVPVVVIEGNRARE